MFGYVQINKPELKVREYYRYRSFYCGLCRTLKNSYGLPGQITLTYDMTFLVMLLNSLYEPKETVSSRRCGLHPLNKHQETVSKFTQYGADMNVLLAYYKQKDDWEDDRSPIGLIHSFLLRRKVRKIEKQYPRQAAAVRKELDLITTLEKEGIADMQAAARSFGRLLGRIFVYRDDHWKKKLYGLGYDLGVFIYLADAWEDLEKDRQSGSFNPIPKIITRKSEAVFRKMLTGIMARAAEKLEYLPLDRDIEILRNIIYAGVWTRLNTLPDAQKKGSRKC